MSCVFNFTLRDYCIYIEASDFRLFGLALLTRKLIGRHAGAIPEIQVWKRMEDIFRKIGKYPFHSTIATISTISTQAWSHFLSKAMEIF